jgi:hypothetical protein
MAQYPAASTTITPSKLVTKANTASQILLAGLTGTTATTSTSDLTMGSWAQVTASTSAQYYITGLSAHNITTTGSSWWGPIYVDIAIGGAGSETLVASASIIGSMTFAATVEPGGNVPLAVPLRISSGTRVAVRAAMYAVNANAKSIIVHLWAVPFTSVEGN